MLHPSKVGKAPICPRCQERKREPYRRYIPDHGSYQSYCRKCRLGKQRERYANVSEEELHRMAERYRPKEQDREAEKV